MGANRWPTSYVDPAELRRAAPLEVVQHGAFVCFVGRERVYVIHMEEFSGAAFDRPVHQTTADAWLRDTVLPRAAPIPGFVVELAAP